MDCWDAIFVPELKMNISVLTPIETHFIYLFVISTGSKALQRGMGREKKFRHNKKELH